MKRFLLANYSASVQKTLTCIIEKAFLDAKITTTALDANHPEQFDIKNVDLLILDFAASNNDGMMVLKQVKILHPRLPVLIIMASPKAWHAPAAFSAGADGFLNEGAAFSELALAVRTILGGGKYFPASVREPLHWMQRVYAKPAPIAKLSLR